MTSDQVDEARLRQLGGDRAEQTVRYVEVTAATGDEFAVFTLAGRRLIVRGDARGVSVDTERARVLAAAGWRWGALTDHGAGVVPAR